MAEETIFKSNQRMASLPACIFEIKYFEKLFLLFQKITEESAELEINRLKRPPDKTDEEFENLKKYCRSLYVVTVQIFGVKGEYILSESMTVFNSPQMPDHVVKIKMDNISKYNYEMKKDPPDNIRVEFDFGKPKIFDFSMSPSNATPNSSLLFVAGNNDTWVTGAYKNVIDSLEDLKSGRGWLHNNNVYDIFLWLFILPLTFLSLYKIDIFRHFQNSSVSRIFIVAVYIYFFFGILYIFRMLFNYTRWVFPRMELLTSSRKGAMIHRGALIFISLAILSPLIYEIFVFIVKLFKP